MMKRKVLVMVILTVLLVQSVMVNAYAETINPELNEIIWDAPPEVLTEEEANFMRENSGKIIFEKNNLQRIDTNGNFTFDFEFSLSSDNFKLSNTSTTISVNSDLVGYGGSERTVYSITLYRKSGLFWISEGSKKFDVGESQKATWSNLPDDATFYIYMSTPTVASPGMRIQGTGKISNFKGI